MSSYQSPENISEIVEKNPQLKKYPIAIVQADFNRSFSDQLLDSCLEGFEEANFPLQNIQKFVVPGSLEIPAIVSQLQKSQKFSGILALGIVIRGGTNHYEIVTEESARGLMICSLSSKIPVINGILGGDNSTHISERIYKGKGFAKALLQMISLTQDI
jgi:6,7-dimethyl-8-ribityllumazine synthase